MNDHIRSLPRVSVVVLNYNRQFALLECIASLKASTYRNFDLLVVDNRSRDKSLEMLRKEHPDVAYTLAPANLGYAGGMNFGLRIALKQNPKYMFMLNSDTYVDPNAMAHLVEAMDAHPRAALANGTFLYYDEQDKIWYAGGEIVSWRASAFSFRKLSVDSQVKKVSFITGCAFLGRTTALESVGGFDDRFFMYLEDAGLSVRLLDMGFELLYVPQARVLHKVEHEGEQPLALYFSVRNRFLFLRDYVAGFSRILGFVYLCTTLSAKVVWWSLARPQLVIAVRCAIRDYRRNAFGIGHGLPLFVKS